MSEDETPAVKAVVSLEDHAYDGGRFIVESEETGRRLITTVSDDAVDELLEMFPGLEDPR